MKKLVVILLAGAFLLGFGMNGFAADPYQSGGVPDREIGFDRTPVGEPPEHPAYKCPSTRYINCMPPVKDSSRRMCDSKYLEWVRHHCPGVQIVY